MTTRTPEGQIKDPELARQMAEVENPHRSKKRLFGLIGPSKKNIETAKWESYKIEYEKNIENKVLTVMEKIADAINKKLKGKGISLPIKTKAKGYSMSGFGGRGATIYVSEKGQIPLLALNLSFEMGKFGFVSYGCNGLNLQSQDAGWRTRNIDEIDEFLKEVERNIDSYYPQDWISQLKFDEPDNTK